ncbi:hypothetical protein D779_1489 [Imhoffiella purpurea]|uniref:Effector-associated domain-containing protein n=2 Tax=Imhoffiella purpurea TaxID=1249627 RepID=W9V766_9GAMM|nr:hypothetical protein D779_1489 [Imhoffiella purpurea]
MGAQPGCGFSVAPGWLLTCAHVVGRAAALGRDIEVYPWGRAPRTLVLRHLRGDLDLALLEDPEGVSVSAVFGGDPQRDQLLVGIGFPVRDQRPELDDFTARFEGITQLHDRTTGGELRLIKLKQGLIDYGFSGGPLIQATTGRVIGVTRLSQDTRLDLGGWAVPAEAVRAFCEDVGVTLAPPGPLQTEVLEAPAKPPVERLRDLLLGLPRWNDRRDRLGFVEIALGRRHPILHEVEWEGSARQLAWDLARACEDYPEPTETGRSPACALLEAIPREFGRSPVRDREIQALSALLDCPKPAGA